MEQLERVQKLRMYFPLPAFPNGLYYEHSSNEQQVEVVRGSANRQLRRVSRAFLVSVFATAHYDIAMLDVLSPPLEEHRRIRFHSPLPFPSLPTWTPAVASAHLPIQAQARISDY